MGGGERDLKLLFDERVEHFDSDSFVREDPLSVVYRLRERCRDTEHYVEQMEVGALFVAIVAWGNRAQIRRDGERLMELCSWRPYDFLIGRGFDTLSDQLPIHRTLFGRAFKGVCENLCRVYGEYGSIERYLLTAPMENPSIDSRYRYVELLARITKPANLGSISSGSVCKRLSMYMRWMVRSEAPDLGLWSEIKPSELFAVMDLHVARRARELGLLSRRSLSWSSVVELTQKFLEWSPDDPLRYDMVLMLDDLEKAK